MNPKSEAALMALASHLISGKGPGLSKELASQLPASAVRSHGLAPLCYQLGIEHFKADFVQNAIFAEMRSKALNLIVASFSEHKIQLCFLKGISYVRSIYRDPAERPMGDIDLLVRDFQMTKAIALLKELGYKERGGKDYMFAPTHHAVTLDSTHISVDLHRSMTQAWRNKIDLDSLWKRANPSARRLALLDEIVLHLAHMARHELMVPLISYVDLARLLGQGVEQGLGREEVIARAKAFHLARGAQQGLAMMDLVAAQDFSEVRIAMLPSAKEVIHATPLPRSRQLISKIRLLDGPRDLLGFLAVTAYERGFRWREKQ